MEYQNLQIKKEGQRAQITLNRPENYNAFTVEMIGELSAAVETLEQDPNIRVVLVTGSGKAFVAGADIKYMQGLGALEAVSYAKDTNAIYEKIAASKKVYIAVINGVALGAGTEFALACDIRLASDKAKFGLPEVGLGILPGGGGTQRLSHLVGMGFAMELILSGRVIGAQEAFGMGLINRVVEAEGLMEAAVELAESIAKNAPIALALAKECVRQSVKVPLGQGLAFEQKQFGLCFATKDQKEGLAAFVEKRPPAFQSK